jgi:hypothetical protein
MLIFRQGVNVVRALGCRILATADNLNKTSIKMNYFIQNNVSDLFFCCTMLYYMALEQKITLSEQDSP